MVFGAFMYGSCTSQKEQAQDELIQEAIAVSLVKVVETQANQEVVGSGLLDTESQINYAFKIGGIIDQVFVEEGQSYKKGQLLATLVLTEIETGFSQANLALEKAKRDYTRVKNLYADSVSTLEQLQDSKTALDLAVQQLEAVAFNKKYAYIYAEQAGMVIKKLANTGEVIGGGVPVLACSLNGAANWELKIGLSDREWAKISLGDQAKVMLDAYPDFWWDAKVFRKSGAADRLTGSFQVELKLVDLPVPAALGMFGKAIIQTGATQTFKLIPYQSLVEADGRNAFVFIPNGPTKVIKKAIQIDSFSDEGVKVLKGLEGVDAVILGNSAFLNENVTIAIKN